MTKFSRVCVLLSMCLSACLSVFAAENSPANTLTDAEKKEGFVLLFDGASLSPDVWQGAIEGYPVENGAFVCRKGGNLMTKEKYGDFVLRFEFRLPPGGNNGLGVRASAMNGDAAYNGMELQILDNLAEKYNSLQPYQFHGSVYGVVPAKRNPARRDYQKPLGEWNEQEVTAISSRIKVVLNGTVILDADLNEFKDKPTIDGNAHPGLHNKTGFLGFLGHGDPVAFRSVRIKKHKAE